MLQLELPGSLATSLASGHPWVYRDHVGKFSAPSGTWVRVRSGSFAAIGIWDPDSAIAVRLFSTEGEVDQAWILERVSAAWNLRQPLRAAGVTGYRLIFGEGDGLPGIVVDLYGEQAVLVTYSKSLGKLCEPVGRAVAEVSGVRSVARRIKQGDRTVLLPLVGGLVEEELSVLEYGMELSAHLTLGQKTGLFFDHRENRQFVRQRARDRRVLNLFSYTGGFSVAAALGGAAHVTSVDIAEGAVAASIDNFARNGLPAERHRALVADVFAFLADAAASKQRYELIVCDPPSFAKNRTQLRTAEKAYRKLFSQVFSVVEPDGLVCAASCTSQVGPQAFRLALMDAARKAKVRFSVIHDVGQPLDHPVQIGHEEGRYLKFVVGRVSPRW